MKKLLLLSTILLLGLTACSSDEPVISVTNVTLYPTTLQLIVGQNATLTATITPSDAHNQTVTWFSHHPNIATVDANGVVTALSGGFAAISATTQDGNFRALSSITVEQNISFPIEGVVIGGIRWATRNVAAPGTFAENPEDFGMLFQWNNRIGWSSADPLVASNGSTTWNSNVSNPPFIEWERANDPCPEGWRVPNKEELEVLARGGTQITRNGVEGFLFGTAPNQIFLPWAGQRDGFSGRLRTDREDVLAYWSRTQHLADAFWQRFDSWNLHTRIGGWPPHIQLTLSNRGFQNSALSIRCVKDTTIPVTDIVLDETEVTMPVGSQKQLFATAFPNEATNRSIAWSSSHPSTDAATVDADGWITSWRIGTVTITARAMDGSGSTATATIIIGEPEVSSSLDGVLINGVRWATRNVDAPGSFAASPVSAGMLFQWNRRVGWSSSNPLVNSEGGTTWDSSLPTGDIWEEVNDPCPEGWRVPSREEFSSLLGSGFNLFTNLNNIYGALLGTAPNQIFLPAIPRRWHNGIGDILGGGDGSTEISMGSYWSRDRRDDFERQAWYLRFWSRSGGAAGINSTIPFDGFSVRCVAK